jgi:chorismate-pyruvate lyase
MNEASDVQMPFYQANVRILILSEQTLNVRLEQLSSSFLSFCILQTTSTPVRFTKALIFCIHTIHAVYVRNVSKRNVLVRANRFRVELLIVMSVRAHYSEIGLVYYVGPRASI